MPSWAPEDVVWMRRVLELAAQAYGETSPNPLVGAVVVGSQGELGSGVHRRAGGPHAEPQALDRALAASMNPNGSEDDLTLYVNLEPCSHQGQTPPCVDAILRSPVRRVVAAIVDPNPQVAGRGIGCLRGAGLRVDVGCLAAAAAELNHVFLARQLRRRPFVALKVALSADACIAGQVEVVAPKADGEAALKGAPRSIKEAISGKGASGAVVSSDGQIVASLLEKSLARQGVIFTDMETALKKHGDLLEPIFMTQIVKPNDGYFAALHGSFWQGGTFMYVPRGVEVPLPLRAATWLKQRHASFPHTIIVMEPDSRAVFVDEYESYTDDRQAFSNGAVVIIVGDGACDGQDVLVVHAAASRAVARARRGEGPTFLLLNTYRYRGHHVGDINRTYYRSKDEEHQ